MRGSSACICVFVDDDGENELTKRDLSPEQRSEKLFEGIQSFSIDIKGLESLKNELLDYGNVPDDVDEAIQYILKAQVNESCIIGNL